MSTTYTTDLPFTSVADAFSDLNTQLVERATRQLKGDYERAQDFAQEVWRIVCTPKHRATFEALPNRRIQHAYLQRCLDNRLLDFFRQRKKCPAANPYHFSYLPEVTRSVSTSLEETLAFYCSHSAPAAQDACDLTLTREELRVIFATLRELPLKAPWQRSTLLMWLDGYQPLDINIVLQRLYPNLTLRPGAVKKFLHTVRVTLRAAEAQFHATDDHDAHAQGDQPYVHPAAAPNLHRSHQRSHRPAA